MEPSPENETELRDGDYRRKIKSNRYFFLNFLLSPNLLLPLQLFSATHFPSQAYPFSFDFSNMLSLKPLFPSIFSHSHPFSLTLQLSLLPLLALSSCFSGSRDFQFLQPPNPIFFLPHGRTP
ncbi:hypothetical protein NE237_018652 [Protea cynaroides]|uniref:Transmembrane protein n=1 Tax=Protea cynaroides TaxID=273540 RepID=A0A9Q0KA85_9MAGN|nr:hypothetical protein NE237_018652 [Protea cynaroides]